MLCKDCNVSNGVLSREWSSATSVCVAVRASLWFVGVSWSGCALKFVHVSIPLVVSSQPLYTVLIRHLPQQANMPSEVILTWTADFTTSWKISCRNRWPALRLKPATGDLTRWHLIANHWSEHSGVTTWYVFHRAKKFIWQLGAALGLWRNIVMGLKYMKPVPKANIFHYRVTSYIHSYKCSTVWWFPLPFLNQLGMAA